MRKMKCVRLLSSLLIVLFSISTSSLAFATQKKPSLAQIEVAKKIEEEKKKSAAISTKKLAALADEVNRKYDSAKNELAVAVSELITATKAVEVAEAEVVQTHRDIGILATGAYISSSNVGGLEIMLSANGLQDAIDTISMLENLGSKNEVTLEKFKAAEKTAKEFKAVAAVAKGRQINVTEKVATAKREADAVRDAQQEEVDKLQAVQDKLQKELASVRKVRLTLEQRRQLAQLEETRSREASKAPNQAKVWKGGGSKGVSNSRTTLEQRLKAVEFAKRQVLAKKPYV